MGGQFDGKVALVTGGNAGIGEASALHFAREGAKVAISARRVAEGERVADKIRDGGGEAVFIQTDMADPEQVEAMVETTVATFGGLDYAFNNAGIVLDVGLTHEHTEEHWDSTIDINLRGLWLCLKYEIPRMIERGGGAVVNNSSGSGIQGGVGRMVYRVSKAGVNSITRTAALEYGRKGIRVNAVLPGAIHTPILDRMEVATPGISDEIRGRMVVGRIGTPEEIANAVVWLCSDDASFVNGVLLSLDGGTTAGRFYQLED